MKLFIIFLALAFAFASGDENEALTGDQENPVDPEILLDSENPEYQEHPDDQENPDGQGEADQIITYGFAAHETTAPYTVSLSLRKNSNNVATLCGGSIIGSTWVLTSAYCLDGHDYVDIHYGSIWKWNGQFSHRVQRNNFFKHHMYPQTSGNDIALIRTPQVFFTDRVNYVRLPTFSQMSERFLHHWTRACGWGSQHTGRQADSLQCVDNQVMDSNECSHYYGYLPIGVMCVRTPNGRSTCNGDFGGALVTHHNPVQIGVTSFVSVVGCTAGHPAGFTRVTAHLDWIRQISGIAYY